MPSRPMGGRSGWLRWDSSITEVASRRKSKRTVRPSVKASKALAA
jgi:hypothetical protein